MVTPTESEVLTALRAYIRSILPNGLVQFTGSISGTTLTASSVTGGTLGLGTPVLGLNVQSGTYIIAVLGPTTFTVNKAQTIASTPMWVGVEVVKGQVNRVPTPRQGDLVVMWPILKRRLSTNVRSNNDVAFQGSILGNTLTVSTMVAGTVSVDTLITGQGVTPGTRILSAISGSGGAGTYLVTPNQSVAQTLISAGSQAVTEPTEYTIQIDVHGPNSSDNAQMISQMFRDPYGVRTIQAVNPGVTPLHADDPRQIPFTNGEQQVETRWIINAVLQANFTMADPGGEQFADNLEVTTVEVEAAFPA